MKAIKKAKATLRRRQQDLLPFPVSTATTLPPSNLEIIRRSSTYKKEFASVFGPKAEQVRDFFLEELVPISTALDSGISDAKDVVESAFDGMTPESYQYEVHMVNLMREALMLKLVDFVGKVANLTPAQRKTFAAMYLTRKANNGQNIMHQLHEILGVQRQKQNQPAPQLQSVDAGPAKKRPR
jgi:hypothetical protein